MNRLSLVVTTLNNDATLERCLASATCADEIVLLDSGSVDNTLPVAERFNARIHYRAFESYGSQKQAAIDLVKNRWVLLLDADEALTPEADNAIAELKKQGFQGAAYELPRAEQIFWRMQSTWTRPNYCLRLFDREQTRMNAIPVHAAPETRGKISRLHTPFLHFGEPDIHTKVDKINAYSTGLAEQKKHRRAARLIMVFYPFFYFLRLYFFKRQFINGWAGFINARTGAFYAFLKYAKAYEAQRRKAQD